MIEQNWKSCLKDARTLPGADCNSDHQLLLARIQMRLKQIAQPPTTLRLDSSTLDEKYKVDINNRFQAFFECDTEEIPPDDLWKLGKEFLVQVAKNTIQKCKKIKNNWISEETRTEIEKRRCLKGTTDEDLYRSIKDLTKKFKPTIDTIKDKNGNALCNGEDVKKRWKTYCEYLYKVNDNLLRNNIVLDQSGEEPPPLDVLECSTNRTISLISHCSKILLKVISGRLKVKLDEEIADEQCGFRANKGTRDQILNLKQIMEKHRERCHNLYMCFIDYRKAFDTVDHETLWRALLEMGFPTYIIHLNKGHYDNQKAVVRTIYGLTDSFNIGQGYILSPHLFNVYSEKIMRDALEGFEGTIKVGGRNVTNLRYADDIVLIAGSMLELEDLITRVKLASEQAGLMLNTQKTKVMKTAGDPENIEMRTLLSKGTGYDILSGMVNGKINKGRPRRKLENDIQKVVGMSIAELLRRAQDRDSWRTTFSCATPGQT
ncbi:uncharacterized protein LOC125041405 [Penaeus chinensis]|uniref:uncharacterized protein LOC125041405 n=1 Tax=Penaeus chinensis TaxID=139456 RepID=UPI001FB7213F|nr:uncharacterized protein LOC125041405 [Penaeus chinensis]